MRIAVATEPADEARVALVPALVQRLLARGSDVLVDPGAGARAGFDDEDYVAAGAVVTDEALTRADVTLSVQALGTASIARLSSGSATLSFFGDADRAERLSALRARDVRAYAMEQVPRISRAQPMDALTSQSLVAGYRAVVVAAELLPRFLGRVVVAGGSLPGAEVLVLGAGVAGLQAIATARQLGATVRGYDVRGSSAEEIASLGATPVDLGLEPLEGAAGYAREMTPERAAEQHRLLAPYVAQADVVITTAAVPGRTAPLLVTEEMLRGMRPGSVVVDIAAEAGGNVEGVRPGEVLDVAGIRLWGGANVPAQVPGTASELYAGNVVHLLELLVADPDDEVVRATLVTG